MKSHFPTLILFIPTDMTDKINIEFDIDALDDLDKVLREEQRLIRKRKNVFKEQLKGLINVTGLYRWLNGDMSFWMPEDIVEIHLTDEKRSGYSSYQHARIVGDDTRFLYMKTDCDEVRGIDHYYVWQTTGCCEDDYYGYLLFPLKDDTYFKISYSC